MVATSSDETTFEWTSIFSAARRVFYFIFPPLIEFLLRLAETLSSVGLDLLESPLSLSLSLFRPFSFSHPDSYIPFSVRLSGLRAGLSSRCISSLRMRYRDDELAVARHVIIFADVTIGPVVIQTLPVTFSAHETAALPIRKVNTPTNTGNREWSVETGKPAVGVDRSLSISLTFYDDGYN